MNDYKISVIVPIYNAEKYLKRCINSIINQSIGFKNIELILLDDNSSDSSKQIIKKFDKKFENIKGIYLTKNHGLPGPVRNIGIFNATAQYIMFLDNDDYYEEDFCEIMYNEISKTNLNIACCNINIKKTKNNPNSILINPLDDFNILNDIVVWNKIFKKSFIKNNDITFSNSLYEDLYFVLNAYFKNNNNILYLYNYNGYHYEIREDEESGVSLSKNADNYKKVNMWIDGLKVSVDLIKKSEHNYLLAHILNQQSILVFVHILKMNNKNNSLDYLNNLYDYASVDLKFDEIWEIIFYKSCRARHYIIINLLSKFYSIYFKSKFFKRHHRNN